MRRLGALAVAAAWLTVAARSAPYHDSPPPAHTGGFGEPTCRACHGDAGLNEPGGTVAMGGVPSRYRPGRAYEVTVVLQRTGMLRAGFEVAARVAEGGAAGLQAGVLTPMDDRTAVVRDSVTGVEYLTHTLAGTPVTAGGSEGRWRFRWTAPVEARGTVVFHVAANAANDDDSPLGDFIYVTAVRVLAGTAR